MPKKPKMLKDIDEFAMKRIEQATKPELLKTSVESYLPKCKKCSGIMERVIPIAELPFGNSGMILELHECKNCHEREYI